MADIGQTSLQVEQSIEVLKDLKASLLPCIYNCKNLLTKLKNNELEVEDGISLFDVKNKMFLGYLLDLVKIAKTKLSCEKLAENPVLNRILEERVILEKIRPIEQKLKYQVDILMKVLSNGTIDQSDPMNLKPNFSNLSENEDDNNDAEQINLDGAEEVEDGYRELKATQRKSKSDVYVPPRLAQMKFEDEADKKVRALERAKKRAINSSLIKELRREFEDAPEEETHSLIRQKSKIGKFLKEKTRFEEDNFIRINLTKKQKAAARKLSTVNSIADDVTRFEDISVLDINDANDFTPQKRSKKPKPKNKKKSFKRRKH